MRKTFLKVALIGLLAAAMPSTFTSCKDYDDDIENLDTQVADLKSQLATVNTTISSLQTSLTAAQSAADKAMQAAQAAQTAADKAAAEGKAAAAAAQAAAIAQAKADLEEVQAKLQAAIDGKADKADVEAINTELSAVKGELETLQALGASLPGQFKALEDKLGAQMSDLADQIAQINKDNTAALETIDAAITKLNEKAEAQGQIIAGLQGQIAQIEATQGTAATDLTALKAELATLKGEITATLGEQSASIEALTSKVADLAEKIQLSGGDVTSLQQTLNLLKGMITHITLVSGTNVGDGDTNLALFNPVKATKTPSSPKATLLFDLKKDDVQPFNDALLVKVTPAGATLDKDQLSLVNSDLKNLDEFVEITSVERYSGDVLTSRAISQNGLYVVNFKLANEEELSEEQQKAFDELVKTENGKNVLYALAYNDTEVEADRAILSEYDVQVWNDDVTPTSVLDFNVNDVNVSKIHNRYVMAEDGSSFMYKGVQNAKTNMDGVYTAAQRQANFEAAKYEGWINVGDYGWKTLGSPELATNDNRTKENMYIVNPDEEFTVTLNKINPASNPIYGFYVTLDDLRATESTDELTAWEKFAENDGIKGLNKVITDANEVTLEITSEAGVPAGDVIGFRVWAVNYSGELVDPDGRAFYVQVGEVSDVEMGSISASILAGGKFTASATTPELGDWTTDYTKIQVTFEMNLPAEAQRASMVAGNNFVLKLGNGNRLTSTMTQAANGTWSMKTTGYNATGYSEYTLGATTSNNVVRTFQTLFSNMTLSISNWKYLDNTPYTGKVTIKDASSQRTLQVINVSVTKTLPSGMPEGFGPKALTETDVVNVYVNNGSTDGQIYVSVQNYFNLAENTTINDYRWGMLTATATEGDLVDPATPEYWSVTPGDPDLNFSGWTKGTGYMMYKYNKDFTSLSDMFVATDPAVHMPTMPFINREKPVTVRFGYVYNNITWKPNDSKVYVVGNVKATKDYQLAIQSIPNFYSFSWNEALMGTSLPEIDYHKSYMISTAAINLTGVNAGSYIRNWTLENALNFNGNDDVRRYYIQTPEITFTEGIEEYMDGQVAGRYSNSNLTVDAKTGVVTMGDMIVLGMPVKKNTAGNYVADFDANGTTAFISVKPNNAGTPTADAIGSLVLNYVDQLGIGNGYSTTYGVIPTQKTLPIKFNF